MKNILVITHSTDPDLGKIRTILKGFNVQLAEHCLPCGDELPTSLDNFDGILMMGSAHGVYDAPTLPWLQKEMAWLEEVGLKTNLPILGICFGAQLLAHMHGGHVTKGSKGTSFGYHPLQVETEDDLFKNTLEGAPIFTSHNDVYTLPEKAIHLASNPFYPQQAAQFEKNIYGLQFHPEVTANIIEKWHQARAKAGLLPKDPQNLEEILQEYHANEKIMESWLKDFLKNLFTLS